MGMRRIASILVLLSLLSITADAAEPKFVPPRGYSLAQLRAAIKSARKGEKFHERKMDMLYSKLLDTRAPEASLDDIPDEPWNKSHNHFEVLTYSIDSEPIDDDLTIVELLGTTRGFNSLTGKSFVPVLFQISTDGEVRASKGRVYFPEDTGGDYQFKVYFDRLKSAEKGMLVFLRPDRSWAMYRDATSGKPKDQLLIVDLNTKVDAKPTPSDATLVPSKQTESQQPKHQFPEDELGKG